MKLLSVFKEVSGVLEALSLMMKILSIILIVIQAVMLFKNNNSAKESLQN